MYREILNELAQWKEKSDRKVLLLAGAKGVGKSYTLQDFGAGFYRNICMFDFDAQEYVRYLFVGEFNKDTILKKLSVSCGESLVADETLVVFENVDVMDNADEIIDFICDELKEFHVAITLKYLEENFLAKNVQLAKKLDVINIYPLSFSEFLIVNKENGFCDRITNQAKQPLTKEENEKLERYLKVYLITGGMPAVVKTYLETFSMESVEAEKARILFAMEEDIENISSAPLKNKVKQVIASIPAQLEKENKKFQYGAVKITARAREYKDAVDWVINNKYATPLYRVKEPIAPLLNQKDEKSFELFANDVGLLASWFGIMYSEIEESNSLFDMKGGALLEQYIYGELLHNPNVNDIYYWISEATARIEFIFQDGAAVIPIEVNLELNEKAQSLKVFRARYDVPMAIRISRDVMQMENKMLVLPLFSIWNL